jgi:hypothetical protein
MIGCMVMVAHAGTCPYGEGTDTVEACTDGSFSVTDRHGHKRQYGEPNGGFERYVGGRFTSGGMSARRLLPCLLPHAIFAYQLIFGFAYNSLILLVGVRGFEPPAPSSRTRCATRLRYTPPRRRSFSPAATCSGALITAP